MLKHNEKYLITGAVGYIGSMLIKHIRSIDETSEITAHVRDSEKAESQLSKGTKMITADLCDKAAMRKTTYEGDYIIHCASTTKSAEMLSRPVSVRKAHGGK